MESKRTALLSVSDKTGLLSLGSGLRKHGVQLIASGGTFAMLSDAGIEVDSIEKRTRFPQLLGGRVKTLDSSIHAGILARDTPSDQEELSKYNIGSKIDYVICNLYPFNETVAKANVTVPEAVENIDIGGVTLLRSAAKNHSRVTVLCDPNDYYDFLKELDTAPGISEASRQKYALKAFEHTAEYDTSISSYFRREFADGSQRISLRYGLNPHMKPAECFVRQGKLPFTALNGSPGYINLLDALNAWQLVRDIRKALDLPAAASFKHVSPAGAACYVPLSEVEKKVFFVDDLVGIDDSRLAVAYARARGCDRMSSFGDFAALSDICDLTTAKLISREVSDGVIAPGYSPEALQVLNKKKGGKYLVLQMDPDYEPTTTETRTIYGVTLRQECNKVEMTKDSFNTVLSCKGEVPQTATRDLVIASLTAKYTQSNSVVYALNGQTTGVGAGQQSISRDEEPFGLFAYYTLYGYLVSGDKSDRFLLQFHTRAVEFLALLSEKKRMKRADKANALGLFCSGEISDIEATFGVKPLTEEDKQEYLKQLRQEACVSSDAFFPFDDNIERAARSRVRYMAAPLGSQNDEQCIATAEKLGITMIEQPTRLFHH